MAGKPKDVPRAPSADFALNVFLAKIADDLTDKDFETLKFYCKGQYGIKKRALEDMKGPLDLFTTLTERGQLDRNNILTLQSMLWHLPRRDLLKKCVEFCKTSDRTLHFKVPRDKPENGYTFLKVHVQGKTLDDYQRDDLEKLRTVVATELLFIPQQFVFIDGLELSNSLVITLMVPEDFIVTALEASSAALEVLSRLSIDVMHVDGKQVYVKSGKGAEDQPKAMESEFGRLIAWNQVKENQVENLEAKVAKCEKSLKSKKEELKNEKEKQTLLILQVLAQVFQYQYDSYVFELEIQKHLNSILKRPLWSLQRLSAATLFRVALKKVKELKYDSDVIYNLLDAQALLLQWQQYSDQHIMNTALQVQIAQLQSRAVFTEYEKGKLAYYHGIGEKDKVMTQREEYFTLMLAQGLSVPISVAISQQGTLAHPEMQKDIVTRLARELKKPEIKKLIKLHAIGEKDRATVEHSAVALLEYILAEHNRRYGLVNLNAFFKKIFAPLDRPELINKVDEHILAVTTAGTGVGGQQHKKKPDKKENEKGRQRHNSSDESTLQEILKEVKTLGERVGKMEKAKTDPFSGLGNFPFTRDMLSTDKISYLSKFMYPENIGKHS